MTAHLFTSTAPLLKPVKSLKISKVIYRVIRTVDEVNFFVCCYSSFLSYSNAAIKTTKQEPALCTGAPVVGLSIPITDRVTAIILIHIDKPMLNLIVLTVALDTLFK